MELPKDEVILLSYVNTKLRDFYPSLDEFCKEVGVDRGYIIEKLGKIDYVYDERLNKFV
ncbi:hypothetical protein GCWU000282_01867 [Catonella morbi ATCC 51271]|uniref:DUF4250 domain-containing protein n=1 Tax=Catonella morbi ATCC 51271 TaxID=592026 RepID=V2Y5M9_9FIRM|nr:DUF4250 domain-containing protein [Catonella morbi]ESL02996.1 hypothetical protein GCWU000282_01867 [Catonella morbi ATCC 51271]